MGHSNLFGRQGEDPPAHHFSQGPGVWTKHFHNFNLQFNILLRGARKWYRNLFHPIQQPETMLEADFYTYCKTETKHYKYKHDKTTETKCMQIIDAVKSSVTLQSCCHFIFSWPIIFSWNTCKRREKIKPSHTWTGFKKKELSIWC